MGEMDASGIEQFRLLKWFNQIRFGRTGTDKKTQFPVAYIWA